MNPSVFLENTSIQTNNLSNIYQEEPSTSSKTSSQVGHSILGVHNVAVPVATRNPVPSVSLPFTPCNRCIAEMHNSHCTNANNDTALILAVHRKDWQEVMRLLQPPLIDVNSTDGAGLTVLHCAVLSDNVEAVRLLMEVDQINLNAVDGNGHTPLMLASANGCRECVKVLCEDTRCDINAKDPSGRTALVLAHPYPAIVDTIQRHHPDTDLDTMTQLTVWLRNLPKISTVLCCRKTSNQLHEDAGFMLMQTSRENLRNDIRHADSSQPR